MNAWYQSWSNLGSSFENKDSENTFCTGINTDLSEKDVMLEQSVREADQQINRVRSSPILPILYDHPTTVPSNRREAAIERLSSLYNNPHFGPKYFRDNAKLIKHLLSIYKTCQNTNYLEMFFLKGSCTGIHIHFNTSTKKRQLVIPLGSPNIEPVRVSIGQFRAWYRKQRRHAFIRVIEAQNEILELQTVLQKAALAYAAAEESACIVEARHNRLWSSFCSTQQMIKDYKRNKVIQKKDEIKDLHDRLSQKIDNVNKIRREMRMYEKKDYLKLLIKEMLSVTKSLNVIAKSQAEQNAFVEKTIKESSDHNLRSRTRNGKQDH